MSTCTDPGFARTPVEAQAELLAVLDAAQSALGGQWDNRDSPSPRECRLTEQSPLGVVFTGLRANPSPPAEGSRVRAVHDILVTHGMDVGTRQTESVITVMGVHPDNKAFYVELQMRAHAMTLSGQSACVEGNIDAELERVNRA
jgi:hypothetical protein